MYFNKRFICSTFILLIFSCKNEPKKITFARISRDVPSVKTVTYPDGKTKLLLTYHKGSLAAIEYFNHNGKWDSISYYKKGQRSSVTHFAYNQDGSSERITFNGDTFFLKQKFDNSHNLIYKEPVDTRHLSKTIWKLKSGSTLVGINKSDTLVLINKDLPPQNRGIKFVGFKPEIIQNSFPTAYVIKPLPEMKNLKQLVICVYLHENNEHKQLLDSLFIPIKK